MAPEVVLRPARPGDAGPLAVISQRSFDSNRLLGAPAVPPGYDDPAWQRRMMRTGDYWCVVVDGDLAGGAIVFDAGEEGRELGRVFLDPDRFRQGIGTRVMELVFAEYPDAGRWILDTPVGNPRTEAFYEGLGFTRFGSLTLDNGVELALYEKLSDGLF
jgi:GNAT superfamily N-acetyltransferase